jgi:mRNA interferase RelE/StbE
MRQLDLQRAALKGLMDLPPKQFRQVVNAIFELLADPTPHYSVVLQGCNYRRISVGEYRVIYRADDKTVFIIVFGNRNDDAVYRALARKL